ncbi:MAG: SRPBCC family protein [Verrucomicrobiales bacterium]
MPIHTLESRQVIPLAIETAWEFFSNPRNLERITPPDLGFKIITPDLPPRIHAGMMIQYQVNALPGIPMTWLTEITQVREREYFVDEQRVGPYALWHHEHCFTDLGNGRAEIHDRVTYRLPLQPFGDLAHPWLVKPRLNQIFEYRKLRVRDMFP